MNGAETEPRSFKIITVGPPAVGKTCLIMKGVNPDFTLPPTYMCTLGVDFKVKTVMHQGQVVKLHIWDTAGQERFLHINRMYYRDSHGVFFVFDVGDRKTFEKVDFFWEDFKEYENPERPAIKILVGNKSDKGKDREVTRQQAEELAVRYGVQYVESSAKTGDGVQQLFEVLVSSLIGLKPTETAGGVGIVKGLGKKRCC
jgi:small GTP-binding protein